MPRLSSGRYIALDTAPLNELVTSLQGGTTAREIAGIRSVEDLFSRVEILFFRDAGEDGGEAQRQRYRVPTPPGLEPYASGYDLITIGEGMADWEARDQAELRAALNEARADRYFRNALAVVRECQRALLDGESPLPETLETWWTQATRQPARRAAGH